MISDRTVLLVIQARMNSKRLPRKVLRDIGGKPMLQHVAERAAMANKVDKVVVATGIACEDDAIELLCSAMGIPCVRGPDTDVLKRYELTVHKFPADIVVRITADCPLIDPVIIDQVVSEFDSSGARYAANRMYDQRTYPIGLDVEVFDCKLLQEADLRAHKSYQREHVTPYMYDGSSNYRLRHVKYHRGNYGAERWTVDTEEDLKLVRLIIGSLPPKDTSWLSVARILDMNTDWRMINQHIKQKAYTVTENGD